MHEYWDGLTPTQRVELAERVGSSAGYLRLVFKGHKKAGFLLARRLEEETHGGVSKTELRPDIYPKS
ncbi:MULTISPECIES: YdaS family helix-turn-helix protein [Enterobacterales]|jgi:DNA-binding transcriptional regulator YdaS (Cro superfamily)|uniref:Transcriptional regulator n=2 Tax=Hafnia TaxID=568 RepID=A0A2A2M9E0_9GAMM|nr:MULTISPECIES: YdaS family helix-turn-helix protein [Enterobacterales]MDN6019251.1 helix-turn-helix domain-containing protein [Enterobacterales bacterium]QXN68761.1 hypothetical protein [Hafnia phage yong2]EHM39303.1 hypothetical protein HMPREF0454_03927 [Hafnia alvei ATCC 51873]KAA0264825.1 transcriptional regulator [Hafnia alvei]MBW2958076.1 helix-turn-helix domain-containing protein [Hafnia paralvei]